MDLYNLDLGDPKFRRLCGGSNNSDGEGESCVEIAQISGHMDVFALRDSKNPFARRRSHGGVDMTVEMTFQRMNAAAARDHRDLVADIHRDAYADRITAGDSFASDLAFMDRFDAYTTRESFDLVFAHVPGPEGEVAVGQAWGWALDARSRWWEGLEAEPEPGFTTETGRRTFALSEIMVRRGFTGRGVARALHDELLRPRPEERSTLLVRPDNTRAYAAYTRWGWRQVGRLRPGWPGAPLMDVLILDHSTVPTRPEP
jgi:ribosomal protein S18 acetylase RimI-like enzyme